MNGYNAPYFGSMQAAFLLYKQRHGEKQALEFMTDLFSARLKVAYNELGFQKGKTEDFARIVRRNDGNLGLRVEVYVLANKIVYRFLDDPFPGLKGTIQAEAFDRTHMDFKVRYLLGHGWGYTTTKHLWEGDRVTEHVIAKS